jgi:hypothetical protein
METTKLNQAKASIFNLLKFTFGIVPIVAGLDKFTNLLTHWDAYISPAVADMLPFSPGTFMMIVGVVEMAAGVIVLVRPAIGGLIVAGWLTVVAISLITGLNHLDVAVRDLVMAVGAFSLAKIAKLVG